VEPWEWGVAYPVLIPGNQIIGTYGKMEILMGKSSGKSSKWNKLL
jgi:hypothetical protein